MGVHNNRNALQIPEKNNRNDPNNDRNGLQKSEKNNRSAMIIRNSRVLDFWFEFWRDLEGFWRDWY